MATNPTKNYASTNCYYIVDCGNYNAKPGNGIPVVEARNGKTYNSSSDVSDNTTRQNLVWTSFVDWRGGFVDYTATRVTVGSLKLQTSCVGHIGKSARPSVDEIQPGSDLTLDKIESLANEINIERVARGKQAYSFSKIPNINDIAITDIISELNAAIDAIKTPTGGRIPSVGDTITANLDPNPVIRALNNIRSECVCYTDCSNYSVCSCYQHSYITNRNQSGAYFCYNNNWDCIQVGPSW